jgi:hypothetical protein
MYQVKQSHKLSRPPQISLELLSLETALTQ